MAVRSNLLHRISAAAVFGPLFLVLFWVGGIPLLIGVCAVAALGTWEYCRMQKNRGLHPWTGVGVAASLVWCLWLHWFEERLWPIPAVVILFVLLTLALGQRAGRFRIADAEATFVGTCYVGLLPAFALLVRNYSGFRSGETGAAWFAVLVLLGIWGTDILAYFGASLGQATSFPEDQPGQDGRGFRGWNRRSSRGYVRWRPRLDVVRASGGDRTGNRGGTQRVLGRSGRVDDQEERGGQGRLGPDSRTRRRAGQIRQFSVRVPLRCIFTCSSCISPPCIPGTLRVRSPVDRNGTWV